MKPITFLNSLGDFCLENAQNYPDIYFPLANEGGMISCITPLLSGDCKTSQNTYLLAPASSETLHESRASRNFWVCMDGFSPWSVTGQSALQQAGKFTKKAETATLECGLLWHKTTRVHTDSGLKAEVLSFVPAGKKRLEIMQVQLTNTGEHTLTLSSVAAIPVYGRSADNIRDHRHVTSLLNRITVTEYGIDLKPTLTFDERGHQKGTVIYRVWGCEENSVPPVGVIPLVRDFVGSGSYDWPQAVLEQELSHLSKVGDTAQGSESIGALFFRKTTLLPGEMIQYQILLAIDDDPSEYLSPDAVKKAFMDTQQWWQNINPISVTTGNPEFDTWCRWVGIQPTLRRICGCSFMPHHDYGRGGRGWRDLWQDSLALLLQDPSAVREDLIRYFAGIRTDGTNATIIGNLPGEFKADRNNIPRVWMDHGFWPLLTTELYINETGDTGILLEEQPYFRDCLAHRGEGSPLPKPGSAKTGSILEHMLIQAVTAFFDVGEHGIMRLRGADWNDGLDMARSRGESVAFTAAYAGNFDTLAQRMSMLSCKQIVLSAPLWELMQSSFGNYGEMRKALYAYCAKMEADTEHIPVSVDSVVQILKKMEQYLKAHIRSNEWISDHQDHHWFNSYYDDHGCPVEGKFDQGIRMMLTGQVFSLLSGTADDTQAAEIVSAADAYLFDGTRGGYCLNTDFREVKLDMGRMFGFAYGTKENGAVFCHMAIMYAYALYSRGFADAGWKVLESLFRQSADFNRSHTLPGIPEYFDDRGVGMYPYLTGSGSWWMLTLQTQVFGVRGNNGDLLLEPKLPSCLYDSRGIAAIACHCAGHKLLVRYHQGSGRISKVCCTENGAVWDNGSIPSAALPDYATLDVYFS